MIEAIKEKIAKLLAKAEGTNNEAEAAAFLAKVNELLERHQIAMHEIRDLKVDNDPMGMTVSDVKLYASMSWAPSLCASLAAFYGCKTVRTRTGANTSKITFIGRESARITCDLMIGYIISQVRVGAKRMEGVSKSVAERKVGDALTIRLMRLAQTNESERQVAVGKGLIPVTDVDAYMREQFTNLKEGRGRKVRLDAQARDIAERISIHRQAGTSAPAKRIA